MGVFVSVFVSGRCQVWKVFRFNRTFSVLKNITFIVYDILQGKKFDIFGDFAYIWGNTTL